MSGRCEAWGTCPSIDIVVTTIVWTGPIWRAMNGLNAANAATLESRRARKLRLLWRGVVGVKDCVDFHAGKFFEDSVHLLGLRLGTSPRT